MSNRVSTSSLSTQANQVPCSFIESLDSLELIPHASPGSAQMTGRRSMNQIYKKLVNQLDNEVAHKKATCDKQAADIAEVKQRLAAMTADDQLAIQKMLLTAREFQKSKDAEIEMLKLELRKKDQLIASLRAEEMKRTICCSDTSQGQIRACKDGHAIRAPAGT